jgi:hypothetical protein
MGIGLMMAKMLAQRKEEQRKISRGKGIRQ